MAYKTPGVYIEEITTFPPSVVAVETAIPAFIGYTETAVDTDGGNLVFTPTRITSLLDFQRRFGRDFVPATYQVVLDTAAGNAVGTVSPQNSGGTERRYYLYASLRHYYANGGGPCYIVSVGSYSDAPSRGDTTTPAGLLGGLSRIEPVDEPTLLVFPDGVSLSATELGSLQAAALAQCEKLQDRFVIMDLRQGDQPITLTLNPIREFRDTVGTNSLKYGAAYYPWVRTIYAPDVHFRQLSVIPTAQSVSAITRSASTATVTTANAHGFKTGQSVTIAGTNQTEYNGTFTITATGANTFAYAVTGTPATPATGTIAAQASLDTLTGDTTLDALPGAMRAADAVVGNVVSAVNVSAMTGPDTTTLTRANFTQLSDHFAALVDELRQLPSTAVDADVRQQFSNLLVLPRALALGLRTLDVQSSVSSITLSANTAMVTTASAHGLTTGQSVTIGGANQAEYNGTFTITVTNATTFAYTVTGAPATPATGTITALTTAQSVSGITRSAGTATVTTASAHGFATGQSVTIADATEAEYNGTFAITVTGASTFTYTVTGTPATPATGTITAQAAQSVSSITRSTTALVTTASAHGFATGQTVIIAGANQTGYNGTFTITVTGANTFTYAITSTPATPATGTTIAQALPLPQTLSLAVTQLRQDTDLAKAVSNLVAYEKNANVMSAVSSSRAVTDVNSDYASLNSSDWIKPNANVGAIVAGVPVSSINRSASTVTVTTASAHGFTTGQNVTVAGANQTEYNGTFTIAVTGASTFTYTVTGTPATPATGTITAQDVFTGANLRETALNAAAALSRYFDKLAAAILSLFSAADFLAGEAEHQLFEKHPVFRDIVEQVGRTMTLLPSSGAVAGVYAAVDRTRGVWKAPANVSLADVSGPAVKINDQGQDDLNVTSSGKSVNALRAFTGKGTLVWGARTLAGNDNEWRYIPVRRFFNMAEESIKKATEPFVFEPNDRSTWVRVRAMIENFLTVLWRQGALAGAVPQQAFFVKVGLGETMTAQDILEGRMIVEIGMAVVRPAEFIILRFAHKMQTS